MNDFQTYPYSDYLVDCWLNNYMLSKIEKEYILQKMNVFQKDHQIKGKKLSTAYLFTLNHFPLTSDIKNMHTFSHVLKELYLKNQLQRPFRMMEDMEGKYERIRLERQLQKWEFDLEHQQTLVDMINICIQYPDVSHVDIRLTNLDFINGKIHTEGRVNLNRLKELAESMLETTKSNPPVIRRITNQSDTKILKRIEEITDEIKKTKRMTFKSTEEIKQSLSQMITSPLEESDETGRDSYVTTMLEIYDVLFYLARMLQKNQPGQLASEVMNQLVHVENILQKVDLEVVQTIGKMLDPEIMEGVGTVSQSQYSHLKEYYVADEILRGFKDGRNNKLIREAKVITVLN